MGESDLHRFLKYIGLAYLHNQRCVLTATEVRLRKPTGEEMDRDDRDNKYVIDVIGWGEKPVYETKHYSTGHPYKRKIGSRNILRGIEVKTSVLDFKNGFASSGCNYHYLLTPMRLVNPTELPNWMGLIEFNRYKFTCGYSSQTERFSWDGIKLVKNPKFIDLEERLVNATMWELAKRANRMLIYHVLKEIQETLSNVIYDASSGNKEEV